MSRFNPSKVLTIDQVDVAVDLIMKGTKYCSPKERARFPSAKTAMLLRLDNRNYGNAGEYVRSRWGQEITERGLSRRSGTLAKKVSDLVTKMGPDNDSVWKVVTRSGGEMGYVCAASEPAARELGWTMLGWAWCSDLAAGSSQVWVERIGMGGWPEAAQMNVGIVNRLQRDVKYEEDRIAKAQKSIEILSSRVEALTSAIVMGGEDTDIETEMELAE